MKSTPPSPAGSPGNLPRHGAAATRRPASIRPRRVNHALAVVSMALATFVVATSIAAAVSTAPSPRGGSADSLVLQVAPGSSASAVLERRTGTGRAAVSFRVPPSYGDRLTVDLVMLSTKGSRSGYSLETQVDAAGRVRASIVRTAKPARPLASRVLPLVAQAGAVIEIEGRAVGTRNPRISMRAWSGASKPGWQLRTSRAAVRTIPSRAPVFVRVAVGADVPATVAVTVNPDDVAPTTPPTTPTSTPTSMSTGTPTGTPTSPTATTPVVQPPGPSGAATDQWGPVGRTWTREDLNELGWDGIQAPRTESITVVDPDVALGDDRPAGRILRSELREGEMAESGGHRSELYGRRPMPWSTPASKWEDPPGSERWYSFWVYVPPGFPVATDTTWLTFTQWKGYEGKSPPVALEIKRSDLRLGGSRANAGAFPDSGNLGPIKFGVWTHLTVGIHFSPDAAEGWVEVYRDGVKKVERTSVDTMDTIDGSVDPIYLKQGIYRSVLWKSTQVLYFSPMTVTDSLPASP